MIVIYLEKLMAERSPSALVVVESSSASKSYIHCNIVVFMVCWGTGRAGILVIQPSGLCVNGCVTTSMIGTSPWISILWSRDYVPLQNFRHHVILFWRWLWSYIFVSIIIPRHYLKPSMIIFCPSHKKAAKQIKSIPLAYYHYIDRKLPFQPRGRWNSIERLYT
jgi:hypothetical protein